jgi:hypothetical protein
VKKLPEDRKARVEYVGTLMFGKRYMRKMAKAAGVSRSLVNKWPPEAGWLLNQHLYRAVKVEELAAQARVKALGELRHQLFLLPRSGP